MSARALYEARGALLLSFALLSCDLENPGDAPPTGSIYFPNALVLSNEEEGAPRFLFVASSNFDLRYNSGVLHAFSLDAIHEAIEDCGEELGSAACVIDARSVLADEVLIPTFSSALALNPDGTRLFVASRTRGTLSVINVDLDADDAARGDGRDPIASTLLGCESAGSRNCGLEATAATDPLTLQPLRQPGEPSAMFAGRLSMLSGNPQDDEVDFVALTHHTGAISFYADAISASGSGSLELASVMRTAPVPSAIALDEASGLLHVAHLSNSLLRFGVAVDSAGTERSVRLVAMDSLPLEGATLGDLRGIAFPDPSLQLQPGHALLLAGVPNALVLADVRPGAGTTLSGRTKRVTEIGAGGSRMALGSIGGRPIAAISCLDGRSVYIVDLSSMQTRAVVPNLSGPFGIALDAARERLYVTDFRSSVVRIIDVSALGDGSNTDGGDEPVRIVATLGRPRVVQELQ